MTTPSTSAFVPSPPRPDSELPIKRDNKQPLGFGTALKTAAKFPITPLVSQERAEKLMPGTALDPVARFAAEYLTDPITLGLVGATIFTGGAAGPVTGSALAARAAARAAAPKGVQLGRNLARTFSTPILDAPRGSMAGKIATRVGSEVGLVGLSAGGQAIGGEIGGTPGAVIGGLAAGIGGYKVITRAGRRAGLTPGDSLEEITKKTKSLNKNQVMRQTTLASVQKEFGSVQDQFNNTWYVKFAKKLKLPKLAEKYGVLSTIPNAARRFVQYVDPAAVAKSIPEQTQVLRVMGEYNADMAAVRMEDYLNENGTARTLFGKIEEDQTNPMLSFFTEGRFAKDSPELQELAKKRPELYKQIIGTDEGISLARIRDEVNPAKNEWGIWDDFLTDQQKEWLKRAQELETLGEKRMLDAGVKYRKTNFDPDDVDSPGSLLDEKSIDDLLENSDSLDETVKEDIKKAWSYSGRKVFVKFDNTGQIEGKAVMGTGGKLYQLGNRISSQKRRSWETVRDAEKEGWRYLPSDQAVIVNLKSRLKKAYDQELLDWLKVRIPDEFNGVRLTTNAEEISYQLGKAGHPNTHEAIIGFTRLAEVAGNLSEKINKNITTVGDVLRLSKKDLYQLNEIVGGKPILKKIQEIKDDVFNPEVTKGSPSGLEKILNRLDPFVKEELNNYGNWKSFAITTRIAQIMRVTGNKSAPLKTLKIRQLQTKAGNEGWDKISKEELDETYDWLAKNYGKQIENNPLTKDDFIGGAELFTNKEISMKTQNIINERIDNYYNKDLKSALNEDEISELTTTLGDYKRKMDVKLEDANNIMKEAKLAAGKKPWEFDFFDTPGLRGRALRVDEIVDPEVKEAVTEFQKEWTRMNEKFNVTKFWTNVNKFNSVQRLFALAGDASIFAIQLIALPMTHPIIFGKTGLTFGATLFRSMKNKQAVIEWKANFMKKNRAVLDKYPGLQTSDNSELFEALQQGGIFDNKIPILSTVGKQAKKRLSYFQDAFIAAQDFAAVEMAKALDPLIAGAANTRANRRIIENYVNNIRGLSNSAQKGISPKQRAIESAVLLAPRYRRATAALYVQALQGGLAGELARKSLISLAAGAAMSTLALQILVSSQEGQTEEELEKKIDKMFDPTSSDFLTVNVDGQRMGIGSKFRSDFKFLAKAVNQIGKEADGESVEPWNDFMATSDNPVITWIKGQQSLAPKTAWEVFSGEDFLGEPAWRPGGEFFSGETIQNFGLKWGVDNFIPIWAQSVMESSNEDKWSLNDIQGRAQRAGGEFFGLRTNPMGIGQILREASWDILEKDFDSLEGFEKDMLKELLKERIEPLEEQQRKRKTTPISMYFNESDKLEADFQRQVRKYAENRRAYPFTPEGHRNFMQQYEKEEIELRALKRDAGQDIEWGEKDEEDSNPNLVALAKYNKMFDKLIDEEGDQIAGAFEPAFNELIATLSREQIQAIYRNRNKTPLPRIVLQRMRIARPNQYREIMISLNLRRQFFIDMGRNDLAEKELERFIID